MLLPTIPAPITTTLAVAGRPVTRIPPPSLTPAHSITRKRARRNPSETSANARQHLLHIGAEDSTAEPGDQRADQHAARPASGPQHRDLDIGASARGRRQPVPPLAPGRPGVGLLGGHRHLAGGRVPLVAVAVPGQGIALGDVGPVGALPVHADVSLVGLRPDGRPLIAEIDQGVEDPARRKVSQDLEANRRHGQPPATVPRMAKPKMITPITVAITSPVVMPRR